MKPSAADHPFTKAFYKLFSKRQDVYFSNKRKYEPARDSCIFFFHFSQRKSEKERVSVGAWGGGCGCGCGGSTDCDAPGSVFQIIKLNKRPQGQSWTLRKEVVNVESRAGCDTLLSSPGKVGYLRTLTAERRTLWAQEGPCPIPCAGLLLHQFPFRTLPPHLPDSGCHFAFSSEEILAWFDHTNPGNISVLSSRATTYWFIRPIPGPWTQN